jgi:hypothetical protein
MHGRLTPAITMVVGLDGTYTLPVGLTYRYSDSLLVDLKYVALGAHSPSRPASSGTAPSSRCG